MNWLIVVQFLMQGLLVIATIFTIIAIGSTMLVWANRNMKRIEAMVTRDLRWWGKDNR